MATQTTDIHFAPTSFGARISAVLTKIGHGFIAISENASRFREIEAYQSLSDEELMKRGIKRDEIVQYVFRDRLFM